MKCTIKDLFVKTITKSLKINLKYNAEDNLVHALLVFLYY